MYLIIKNNYLITMVYKGLKQIAVYKALVSNRYNIQQNQRVPLFRSPFFM